MILKKIAIAMILALTLNSCTPSIGIGIPIGRFGFVGVNSNGNLSAGVGAGVGYFNYGGSDEWGGVYQAFAGLAYELTETIDLTAGGRYTCTPDVDDADQWSYGIGLTYKF